MNCRQAYVKLEFWLNRCLRFSASFVWQHLLVKQTGSCITKVQPWLKTLTVSLFLTYTIFNAIFYPNQNATCEVVSLKEISGRLFPCLPSFLFLSIVIARLSFEGRNHLMRYCSLLQFHRECSEKFLKVLRLPELSCWYASLGFVKLLWWGSNASLQCWRIWYSIIWSLILFFNLLNFIWIIHLCLWKDYHGLGIPYNQLSCLSHWVLHSLKPEHPH